MRAQSILPATIATAIAISSWVGGCGGDDTQTAKTGSSSSSSSGEGGNSGSSSSSGSGGAGGSVTPPPANDKCPGEAVSLNIGDTKTVNGSTEFAFDDQSPKCASGNDPDVVYELTIGANGTFKARATAAAGSTLNPSLYLESACGDSASTIQCSDAGAAGVEALSLDLAAGTYYLVVDGAGGDPGAFDLMLSLADPVCGDHVLTAPEACDPPGPGCDATCQFQMPVVGQDKCPAGGGLFQIAATGLNIPDQFTTGFTDNYAPATCATLGAMGPDRVYQLIPEISGMMTVKIGYDVDGVTPSCDQDPESPSCFDRILYVRTTCGDSTSEIACANTAAYSPESITFPVTELMQYYVFVDGASAASFGTYTLSVTLQP